MFVALTYLTSIFFGFTPPTLVTSFSCITLRSFFCISYGSSPISSRNSVPPSTSSIIPSFPRFLAPEKAPSSYPKSSDSMSSAGIAPQLTAIKGFSLLELLLCMYLATTSFPTPVSPVMNMDESDLAALSIIFLTFFISRLMLTYSLASCISSASGASFSSYCFILSSFAILEISLPVSTPPFMLSSESNRGMAVYAIILPVGYIMFLYTFFLASSILIIMGSLTSPKSMS